MRTAEGAFTALAASTPLPRPSSPSSPSSGSAPSSGGPLAPQPFDEFSCTAVFFPLLLAVLLAAILYGGALAGAQSTSQALKRRPAHGWNAKLGLAVLVALQLAQLIVEVARTFVIFAAHFGDLSTFSHHRLSDTLAPLLGVVIQSLAQLLFLQRVQSLGTTVQKSTVLRRAVLLAMLVGWAASAVSGIGFAMQVRSLKSSTILVPGQPGGAVLDRYALIWLFSGASVSLASAVMLLRMAAAFTLLASPPPRRRPIYLAKEADAATVSTDSSVFFDRPYLVYSTTGTGPGQSLELPTVPPYSARLPHHVTLSNSQVSSASRYTPPDRLSGSGSLHRHPYASPLTSVTSGTEATPSSACSQEVVVQPSRAVNRVTEEVKGLETVSAFEGAHGEDSSAVEKMVKKDTVSRVFREILSFRRPSQSSSKTLLTSPSQRASTDSSLQYDPDRSRSVTPELPLSSFSTRPSVPDGSVELAKVDFDGASPSSPLAATYASIEPLFSSSPCTVKYRHNPPPLPLPPPPNTGSGDLPRHGTGGAGKRSGHARWSSVLSGFTQASESSFGCRDRRA
ncbi:hypothetical protein JCM11641_003972 [Rhodosporidiobolus odoratus]